MSTATKTTWKIDADHSEVGFKVKHMMISTVKGAFEDFNATVETESDNFKKAGFNFVAKN